jgi:hypothetical protein
MVDECSFVYPKPSNRPSESIETIDFKLQPASILGFIYVANSIQLWRRQILFSLPYALCRKTAMQ